MMHRFIGILAMAAWVGGGFQQPANPSPDAERRQDVYAIYSTLMSNPDTSSASTANSTYIIANTTKAPMGPTPRQIAGNAPYPCVEPPAGYESRWAEVLADFNARKDTPATLDRALNITKPYLLLPPADEDAFTSLKRGTGTLVTTAGLTADADPRFKGVRDIFTLSDVYFNKTRTLALTGIKNWCGLLCSKGEWKIYEKISDGSWKEVRPAISPHFSPAIGMSEI